MLCPQGFESHRCRFVAGARITIATCDLTKGRSVADTCRGESGWCPGRTSTPGAWRHAGVRFPLSGGRRKMQKPYIGDAGGHTAASFGCATASKTNARLTNKQTIHDLDVYKRWQSYRVECTGSLPTSEIKRRKARLIIGWGPSGKTSGCCQLFANET